MASSLASMLTILGSIRTLSCSRLRVEGARMHRQQARRSGLGVTAQRSRKQHGRCTAPHMLRRRQKVPRCGEAAACRSPHTGSVDTSDFTLIPPGPVPHADATTPTCNSRVSFESRNGTCTASAARA
eukprot:365445-Chlamydomonas_euryale.AAC.9